MNDLARNILKEQSIMKIVLNGGHKLDNATIPFQIGFDKSIADSKPTHILVIDVIGDPFTSIYKNGKNERHFSDSISERTLFKLKPVQFQHLQLKKPGTHHLLFILFKKINKDYRQFLLNKAFHEHENFNSLPFSSIERITLNNQLCYAEVVVDVPELFFSKKPKTKFQKAIHAWVNIWYKLLAVKSKSIRTLC